MQITHYTEPTLHNSSQLSLPFLPISVLLSVGSGDEPVKQHFGFGLDLALDLDLYLYFLQNHTGADPGNRSWGGDKIRGAHHPCMLGCPISIQVEDPKL